MPAVPAPPALREPVAKRARFNITASAAVHDPGTAPMSTVVVPCVSQ